VLVSGAGRPDSSNQDRNLIVQNVIVFMHLASDILVASAAGTSLADTILRRGITRAHGRNDAPRAAARAIHPERSTVELRDGQFPAPHPTPSANQPTRNADATVTTIVFTRAPAPLS
jgi:hypothetical protein